MFNAAWKLAETAPTNERWAASLGLLYEQLQPDAFSTKDPLAIADRWHIDANDAEAMEWQEKDQAIGYLGNKERVRKGCKLLAELLASEDRAFRAAAYAVGNLNADQLRAGYEKDKELVFNEAIRNLALRKRQPTRQTLHDIAWDVVRNDKHSDLMAANHFNSMAKDIRKKHPAWFEDEEGGEGSIYEEVDDQAPATKADISAIADHMKWQSQGMDAIAQGLRSLMSRAGWI